MHRNSRQLLTAVLVACASHYAMPFYPPAAIAAPTLNWDASLDDVTANADADADADADLESSINQTGNDTEWSFGTGVNTSGPASNVSGDTAWFQFPVARAAMSSFQTEKPDGNLTQSDMTFELIFRPIDFLGKYLLIETGGNDAGLAFNIAGSALNMIVKDANIAAQRAIAAYLLVGEADLFHQLVVNSGVSTVAGTNVVRLLHVDDPVNGPLSAAGVLRDWVGGSASGLDRVNGNLPPDASEYANLDADVAVVTYHQDGILTAGQLKSNFHAIAGESSGVNAPNPFLAAMVVMGFSVIGAGMIILQLQTRRNWLELTSPASTVSPIKLPRREAPEHRSPYRHIYWLTALALHAWTNLLRANLNRYDRRRSKRVYPCIIGRRPVVING